MGLLLLHEFHQAAGARFIEVNGEEVVGRYADPAAEDAALHGGAGLIDLSCRARLCLLGADRAHFLHGQVTNNVKELRTGEGCYAALVSAKGKIQSDLRIYALENELLLDLEPGLGATVQSRLEKYIITEDVQVADVATQYGLWSVQGPKAAAVLKALPWQLSVPEKPGAVTKVEDPALGEIYVTAQARTVLTGFDIFVPHPAMPIAADQLRAAGARLCGWEALEIARIEAGLPRFGADMDESNLAPEVLGPNAISYAKGCYIGQEVIARVRTYGQVAKALRGLRLPDGLSILPAKGDKLFVDEKEAGYVTSAAASPHLKANIALGCIRREANAPGTALLVQTRAGKVPAVVADLPFRL